MATTTTVHAQLIRYATNGDQVIVNLKSAGSDISIDCTSNTKLPTTVSSAQTLANALGSLAFKDSLAKGDVGLGNVDNTADANKSVKYATSAGSAGSATKAAQDSGGQQINSTYIKGISISGRTVTITKGDGTTSTQTSQDTTYSAMTAATSSAAGKAGLVPAPAAGAQGKFLRGDGTWQTPSNTWRGVQDNLTSTATDQSLSANQGKVLKGLVDARLVREEWSCTVKCATWSRLCKVDAKTNVTGSSFLLNVHATRGNVVYNDTFMIKAHHSSNGVITKISGSKYGSVISIRTVSDSNGNCYVELKDTANSATNSTTQSVTCTFLSISAGTLTKYTAFTDGSTLPTDFKETASITTNTNSLQGNLTWGEITGKPSTFAPSSHTHNYAGSSSAGGSATSAVKLDTATAGSATQPVYFTGGKPSACTYTLGKSVPADAVFTDHTYSAFKGATSSAAGGAGLVPAPATGNVNQFLRGDGAWATPTDTKYSHPNSGVTAGTYKSVTVNAQGHVTGGSNPTTLSGYGITDAAAKSHTHTASQITDNIPASKISGVLSLDNIPQGALERVYVAADDTARLALTTDQVQNGDVVKVTSTGKMYFVVDQTKLTSEDGYMIFTAGTASAVAWSNVTGKPTSFTPASHTHSYAGASSSGGSATSAVKLDTATAGSATQPVYFTGGKPSACTYTLGKSVPSDAVFTDHTYSVMTAATASAAGSSGLVPAPAAGKQGQFLRGDGTWATPTNTTYSNMTAATSSAAGKAGLVPAPAAGAQGKFLRGDGTWQTPTNTTYSAFKGATSSAAGGSGLVPAPATGNVGQFLRGDGTWATPTDTKYTHPSSGVTAGTYKSVTVNAAGHVTAGSNPTTLAGYGITDAAAKTHTHNYAGSSSAGGAANSAVKLSTARTINGVSFDGSANITVTANPTPNELVAKDLNTVTTPGFYFSGGSNTCTNKPSNVDAFGLVVYKTAAGYTAQILTEGNTSLGKTWYRQHNASAWSDWGYYYSTGYKPSKSDVGLGNVDNTADANKSVKYATSAGSANAVAWANVTGKPSTYTPATHTHNYAGSSSAGGSATSAVKLATARTVSGGTDITMSFSYDGSANSSATLGYYNATATVGNTNNYPFHRFAKVDTITGSYTDVSSTFLITQDYTGGGYGIVRVILRTNNSSAVSTVDVKWIVRSGLAIDSVQAGLYNVYGKTYADVFFKTGGSYAGTVIRAITNGARGSIKRAWTLINSSEVDGTTTSDAKTSKECYVTIAAAGTALHSQAYTNIVSGSNAGAVSYADSTNTANSATKLSSSAGSATQPVYFSDGKPVETTYTLGKSVPSDAKFTDTTYSAATSSANGLMTSTDKAKLDFGDIVYVSSSTPTKACIWVKLDS